MDMVADGCVGISVLRSRRTRAERDLSDTTVCGAGIETRLLMFPAITVSSGARYTIERLLDHIHVNCVVG